MPKRQRLGRRNIGLDGRTVRTFLGSTNAGIASATDHGGLLGLSDDDHPQYGALAQNEVATALWSFSAGLSVGSPGLTVSAGGADITGGLTIQTGGISVVAGDLTFTGSQSITNTAGDLIINPNADLVVQAPALEFDQEATVRTTAGDLILDPIGNLIVPATSSVGINVDPPEGTLHVLTSSVGAVAVSTAGDDLVLESNNAGMTFVTNDNSQAQIYFATPTGGNIYSGIQFFGPTHGTQPDEMRFRIAGSNFADWVGTGTVEYQQATTITTTVGDLFLAAADEVRIDPTSNVHIIGGGDVQFNPTGNDVFPTNTFDLNLGLITNKWLTIHAAELWVETLVAQETIATIGGRIIVVPTTKLIAQVGPSDTSIDVEHNQIQSGDIIFLQTGLPLPRIEFMSATSGPTTITGGFRYNVTRNLDGTGANTWYEGDAVVNTGTTGSGFIDLYSLESINGRRFDFIFRDDGGVFSSNITDSSFEDIFPDPSAIGDALYIGMELTTFENVFFNVVTAAAGGAHTWEYWNGATWAAMTTTATPNFSAGGLQNLLYSAASQTGWAATTVNGQSAFWIRARVTTAFTTVPVQGGQRIRGNKSQFGPTIAFNVRTGTGFAQWEEFAAIGNLNGLYDIGYDNTFGVGIGRASDNHITIDETNGIRMFADDGNTVIGQWVGSTLTLGDPSVENVQITSTAVQMRDGATPWFNLSGGALTMGQNAAAPTTENVNIVSTAVQIRDGTTVYLQVGAGWLTVGRTDQDHILITATQIEMRDSASNVTGSWNGDTITLGRVAGGEYVTISGTGIDMFSAGVSKLNIANNGDVRLGDTGGASIFWDESAGFLDVLNDAGGSYIRFDGNTANDRLEWGLPWAGKLDDNGIAVRSIQATAKLYFISGNLSATSGPLQMRAELGAGSGEYDGWVEMPDDTGDTAARNTLHIFTSGQDAGTGTGQDMEIRLHSHGNGTEYIRYYQNGTVRFEMRDNSFKIGTTDNTITGHSRGLVIDNAGNDDFGTIVLIDSTDVSHGWTSVFQNNVYGSLGKQDTTAGGLVIFGIMDSADNSLALHLIGFIAGSTAVTTETTGSFGVVEIDGRKASGSSSQAVGSDENAVTMGTNGLVRFILKGSGQVWTDVGASHSTYDHYDDLALVRAAQLEVGDPATIIRDRFDDLVRYNRDDLIRARLLSEGGFMNNQGFIMLNSGAIWQLAKRVVELEEKIETLIQ